MGHKHGAQAPRRLDTKLYRRGLFSATTLIVNSAPRLEKKIGWGIPVLSSNREKQSV